MFWLGKKWGRAGVTQCLCVLGGDCSKPCRATAQIIIRAINEAAAALSAGAGRRQQRVRNELSLTPRSWRSFDMGRGCSAPLPVPHFFPASRAHGCPCVSEPSSPAVPLGCFAHHVAVLLFRLYLASVSINSFPQGCGCAVALWLWGLLGFVGLGCGCSPGVPFLYQPLLFYSRDL